ncbi:zeta toxin family protein [Ralstonia pseudosolanacearum]|uniref:zeta toxin family protein n=1 Tax=Ralstonia pseudosolanacearum TaxID=1310165 RepID=UPI001FF75EAA|nr:zeta toxin family protein [Ralstonia pseudosolanacearum]
MTDAGGPLLVVIAGHNGAGKSTCYRVYLREFLEQRIEEHIDPDAIEREIRSSWLGAPLTDKAFSELARNEADGMRKALLANGVSFSMETVFSDPVGDKLGFIEEAMRRGYFVVLLGVGLDSPQKSMERVALRVAAGGHNVPQAKIEERYPRVIANLQVGVHIVSLALLVDNSNDNLEDDDGAYFAFAIFSNGTLVEAATELPEWWPQT